MAYLAIDDQAADHPKIEALSDRAFRLWFKGITYCQRFLTDGYIPADVARGLRGWSKATQDELARVIPPFKGPLWHLKDDGSVQVHDYLDWNDSREEVLKRRATKADRMKTWRDGKRDTPRDAPQKRLRDAPRAPVHNHNHTVAEATGTGAPIIARRNTRVLNEADPVQFPATLSTEFQAVIRPTLPEDADPYTALLEWVHRVSDATVEAHGGAPRALLEDAFGWWRARLAEDWGVGNKPKVCSRRHTPPCSDEAACTKRYIDELNESARAVR